MSLSQRGQQWASTGSKLLVWKVAQNLYNEHKNPDGYIGLGLAENTLLHDRLATYIRDHHLSLDSASLTYRDGFSGYRTIRASLARFLNQHFNPVEPISAEHVTVTNGVSASTEHLCSIVADPGDAIILGQPHYNSFRGDIQLRTGAELVPVSFHGVDPLGDGCVKFYEAAIVACRARGQRVAGLVLCNPHNPLGRCYSRNALVGIMRLCGKYGVHLISDEIYALSVWRVSEDGESAGGGGPVMQPFHSVLSIDSTDVIDPSLVHVLWGMSKDFGASGLRLGCIVSQHNTAVQVAMDAVSKYSCASAVVENFVAGLLDDGKFVEEYLTANRQRLLENYNIITRWADEHGIMYEKGVNAAFFLWTDLGTFYSHQCSAAGKHMHISSLDGNDIEKVLFDAFLKEKVFVGLGAGFTAEQSGWFRITYSQPTEILMKGLERIVLAVSKVVSST